jgi:aryl-alcohol dehydrogenase-like predicted oxidoreductase
VRSQLFGGMTWGLSMALHEESVLGINHIDTSDYYGPHITNQLIRRALALYPDELVIVTKIGGRRGADVAWHPVFHTHVDALCQQKQLSMLLLLSA